MEQQDRDHHEGERIVELIVEPTRFAAQTVIEELEKRGIKAMITGDDAGGMRPSLGFVNGYQVMVFEGDLDAATAITRDLPGLS